MDQIGPDKKLEIEREIINMITTSLESGQLANDQLHLVANFIKEELPTVENHAQLIAFFERFAASWPVFATLGNIEMGRAIEGQRQDTLASTSAMIKNGDVEQALTNMKGASAPLGR